MTKHRIVVRTTEDKYHLWIAGVYDKEDIEHGGDYISKKSKTKYQDSSDKITVIPDDEYEQIVNNKNRRSDAGEITNNIDGAISKEEPQRIDLYEFENLVATIWESHGWDTAVTSGSGDRGIDVVATKKGITNEKQVLQVKRYAKGNKVGSQDIRNYATLYQQEPDIDSVVMVTSSDFTDSAKTLAADLSIKLVNGDRLCEVLKNSDIKQLNHKNNLNSTQEKQKIQDPQTKKLQGLLRQAILLRKRA
jgi:restriction endonuclease Mrr